MAQGSISEGLEFKVRTLALVNYNNYCYLILCTCIMTPLLIIIDTGLGSSIYVIYIHICSIIATVVICVLLQY